MSGASRAKGHDAGREIPPGSDRIVAGATSQGRIEMGPYGFVAVGLGASLGAWLRWGLGHRLNAVFPTVPLGTLTANLLGGFLVGVAVAVFSRHPGLPPEARLLVVTGFLGGLTTFSTFSAEVVSLVARAEYLWAAVTAGTHLAGSLLLTGLGIYLADVLMGARA
jgi:fluoride exporter